MKLRNYIVFDTKTFFANKEFVIKRARFNEDKGCITLTVTIVNDGDQQINLYESFYVHLVKDIDPSAINHYPVGSKVEFLQVGKATPWGDYQSNLSVEAVVKVTR